MIGSGLQHLLQSPMGGGQQQQLLDPNDLVSQIMEQFREYVRKRGTGAIPMGGRQGIQRPAQQSIQAPMGMPPREKAGRLRTATGEGAATFMEQAGEAAAEPWKPKALDIGLMAASIAMPIIAAMQPEGRGRRGQRKQQRMSNLFKTLGGFAGQGLQARMGSFQEGKEAAYGAAETRAEMSVDEAQAQYERKISGLEAAEGKRRWGKEFGLAEKALELKGLPKAEKPLFTAGQLYQQDRNAQADARKQILAQANQIIMPLQLGDQIFAIKSIQDLDAMIFEIEQGDVLHMTRGLPPAAGRRTNALAPILARLKELRDQYYGGETPMGGGKPPDMTDTEWQEYLQMKGM